MEYNITPIVSIIVPIYNAEKSLIRCVESILAQKFIDFELILVDDGSVDSSKSICNAFAQKDNRINVIHKKNGGASSARNVGLALAKGEYIAFADADDWMDDDWLSCMVENIYDTDLVVTGHIMHDCEKDIAIDLTNTFYSKNDIGDGCYKLLNSNQMGYLWSMLFRSTIIKTNHILMDEKMSLQEDLDFILRFLHHTTSFKTVNSCHYHYYFVNKVSYQFTVYGIERIMSSLKMILSEPQFNHWRNIYGDLVILIPLKNNTINSIKEIKKYVLQHGSFYYSSTAAIFFKIETILPASLAVFFLRIAKYFLRKMNKIND
jgi:glycosyltransferase involved in cell wall biosynthesis